MLAHWPAAAHHTQTRLRVGLQCRNAGICPVAKDGILFPPLASLSLTDSCEGCKWTACRLLRACPVHVHAAEQVRQSAGLLLKNNLKEQYAATTEEFRQYIKVCIKLMPLVN